MKLSYHEQIIRQRQRSRAAAQLYARNCIEEVHSCKLLNHREYGR